MRAIRASPARSSSCRSPFLPASRFQRVEGAERQAVLALKDEPPEAQGDREWTTVGGPEALQMHSER